MLLGQGCGGDGVNMEGPDLDFSKGEICVLMAHKFDLSMLRWLAVLY